MDKQRYLAESYSALKKQGIIKTWKDFAALLDVNATCLSAAKNGQEAYLTDSLISKVESLMDSYKVSTRNINITNSPNSPVATNHSRIEYHQNTEAPQYAPDLVPTIPFKVYNETGINLQEYVQNNPVPKGPAIAQFATTDLHMFVSNDEMKPHLRSGDVLSLKRVEQKAPIVNGEIYVVNSHYLGLTVRFLFDRGTHYELKSSNDWFEPFNIPKEQVFGIYRILGLVRTNL